MKVSIYLECRKCQMEWTEEVELPYNSYDKECPECGEESEGNFLIQTIY